ncbi:MAG: MMPL family transporter [Planctomycetota bacterium]
MKQSFFQKYSLIILMVVFFFVPFGIRGARMAVQGMRNEVKDWLPEGFKETRQLDEFRRYFWGEGFVLVSWDGCRGTLDDQRFRLFVDKFFHETPPSQAEEPPAEEPLIDEDLGLYVRRLTTNSPQSVPDFVGNQLGLYYTGDYHENWAGRKEKWMRGDEDRWYFILPSGDLYEWHERDTIVAAGVRNAKRRMGMELPLEGTLVANLGPVDGPWYYQNPRRLEADMFKSLITGPSVLHDLTREGGACQGDVDAAMERLEGWLYGPDHEQTCLLITLSNRGRKHMHRSLGRGLLGRARGKLLTLADESGLQAAPTPSTLPPLIDKLFETPVAPSSAPELHLGGPAVDNVAIDEEGQITLLRLVGVSTGLGLFFCWISFRNLPVVLMLMFVGAVGAISSMSFIWWGGSLMDAVLMSMPSLVYVLGLSGAVHIVNYYRDTCRPDENLDSPSGSATEALKLGWKPCSLAAFTTAIGLVSLSGSEVVPIQKFGVFSAIGVVFTLTLLFLFLPAALTLWPPRNFAPPRENERGGISDLVGAFWRRVGEFSVKHHTLVTVASLLLLGGMALGLLRMQTSVQLLKLFHPDSRIIHDYQWLENDIGKLVPMEMLVKIKPDVMRASELHEQGTDDPEDKYRLTFLERMELTDYIRKVINHRFGPANEDLTGTAMLAASFVPELPGPGGSTQQATTRGAYSRTLTEYRDDIIGSDFFRVDADNGDEVWRISLRLRALKENEDVDYGRFVVQLKQHVEPLLAAYRTREQVLRQIVASRDDDRYRGSRVLILGAPLGPSKARISGEKTESPVGNAADEEWLVQGRIFATTLINLMRNAALGARYWHDPRLEIEEGWEDSLGDYDCVVLMDADARYDLDRIKAACPCVIDATQFAFPADADAPTALDDGEDVAVMYTGLVPVVYKAQRSLLSSLISSTFWAFISISIIMMIVLRSGQAGLVSMLPNVFPVVVVFGIMGWSHILVDIGSMMTASVAMGVAVDDTVHFLTWFRRGLDEGMSRHNAIRLAYDRCATAMTQTTLIAGVGLSVFAFSTFVPTSRFGVMMLTLLVAALVGDLVFLPALLAGRAGRVFERSGGTPEIALAGITPSPSDIVEAPRVDTTPETPSLKRQSPTHSSKALEK